MDGGTWLGRLLRRRMRLLRLLSAAGAGRVGVLCGVQLAGAVLPAASAVAAGMVVGAVTSAVADGEGISAGALAGPLGLFAAVLLVSQLVESSRWVVTQDVSRRIDGHVRARAREIVLRPAGIEHLEDSGVQDEVARASDLGRRGNLARSAGSAAVGQATLMFRVLSALAAAVVVAEFSVWLAVVLLALALTIRGIGRRQWMRMSAKFDQGTRGRRRSEHWLGLGTGADAAKEVRLFGLPAWVSEVCRGHMWAALEEGFIDRERVMRRQWAAIGLGAIAAFLALWAPGRAAVNGDIELSQLARVIVAAWGVFEMSAMGQEAFDIEYGGAAVAALDRLDARQLAPSASATPAPDGPAAPAIRFDGVTFAYPEAPRPVLDSLTLDIAPGQVLGVVGVNGAGKTTLIKLLAGLYQPSAGRVLIDGTPLAEMDPAGWRRRLTVLFQDFLRYPMTVDDNVRLGAPEHDDAAGVAPALAAAGAAGLVAAMPSGTGTSLWRGGTGGRDLSGGQWQRLAIARALYARGHGRSVVVLDEPTAHLDVAAEAEFYDTVVAAAEGATVVLISHRFSTIRRADRIVLLADGAIAESGSHVELMAAGGEYARLFALQAARFDGGEDQ